jgi:hypothetical protein
MMGIRQVQLRAAYDALYDLRASFDRQVAAMRTEIDAHSRSVSGSPRKRTKCREVPERACRRQKATMLSLARYDRTELKNCCTGHH